MTKIFLFFPIILSLLFRVSFSARILASVFIPSLGHQIPFRPLWKELAKRGHEITLLTTDPMKDPFLKNIKEIDLSGSYEVWEKQDFNEVDTQQDFSSHIRKLNAWDEVVKWQLSQQEIKDLIQNGKDYYDVLIVDITNPIYLAFAERFKIPVVGISPVDCPERIHSQVGNYVHPILYPNHVLPMSTPLNFKDRLISTTVSWFNWYLQYQKQYPRENEIIKQHFGKDIRNLKEIEKDISLLILNVNPVIERVRPTGLNTILIGGQLNIQKPKELPTDLKLFLDSSKEGVIYLNLGIDILNQETQQIIMDTFANLPYTVLWKSESIIKNLPSNIRVMKWIPQQDVFSHPNMKLFVTGCSLQSLEEAIFNTVPVLALPFTREQQHYSRIVEYRNIGLYLNKEHITKEKLGSCVKEVISNLKYKNNVIELAELVKDSEMDGLSRAVWWIEYCIRTKGAKHLKSPVNDIPLYQFYMLDVYSLIIFVLLSPLLLMLILMKCFVWYFARKRKHGKRKYE